jgi:uncharacterized protein
MTMDPITYSLKENKSNSNQFYKELNEFTSSMLPEADSLLGADVILFEKFIRSENIENFRSHNEYLLELLSLGIYWKTYINRALSLGHFGYVLLSILYSLRKKSKVLKPYIDKLRGYLSDVYLFNDSNKSHYFYSKSNLKRLIKWFKATGDLNEEVIRFEHWQRYFMMTDANVLSDSLTKAVEFAILFEDRAKDKFHNYTQYLDEFFRKRYSNYHYKEDAIFCGRKEVEYHLNMFSAEVLNKCYAFEFGQTKNKVVLLPTCIRTVSDEECKAKKKEKDIICIQCRKECRIGQISKVLKDNGY